MKTEILFPGKSKPRALQEAEALYTKRLKKYQMQVENYREEKVQAGQPDAAQVAEAQRILKQIGPQDYLIACDERGERLTTEALAGLYREVRARSGHWHAYKRIVIVIGGAHGLDATVRERANQIVALSGLVLAGGVARVVLLEALYRAMCLLDGHPYHNE